MIQGNFKHTKFEIEVLSNINKNWTLFLDRDGVINRKRDNDYVKTLEELIILPGAYEAIAHFSQIFGRIVIVTNQQGIGKKLMTSKTLDDIHDSISRDIEQLGGKIDRFYHAPNLAADNSPLRKPDIGMALQAKKDFPEIDFSRSIMIGDSPSDMEFGKNAGIPSVFISPHQSSPQYDYTISSLQEFSAVLHNLSAKK